MNKNDNRFLKKYEVNVWEYINISHFWTNGHCLVKPCDHKKTGADATVSLFHLKYQ